MEESKSAVTRHDGDGALNSSPHKRGSYHKPAARKAAFLLEINMAAEALIGNDFKFQVGDGESPEGFDDFCAVSAVGELGEEKPLIDITTLCSDAREYRNGLADGVNPSGGRLA